MPGKLLFEYAIIRIVPRVEREEFLNVGVILYCRDRKFLEVKYRLDPDRLCQLHPDCDIQSIANNLQSFNDIAQGKKGAGPISLLSPPERFRWLTAMRSTVIQSSKVHPGLCTDPADMLDHLFKTLVL